MAPPFPVSTYYARTPLLKGEEAEILPESRSSFFSLLKPLRGAIRPGGKFTHPRGWLGLGAAT